MDFFDSSNIGQQLLRNPLFQAMNKQVVQYIKDNATPGQLLPIPAPPLVKLNFTNFNPLGKSPDLFWSFRGTQGMSVSGYGYLTNGSVTGNLEYTITDTAGFKAKDASPLEPFITAMHNYQTNCGQPKYADGPRAFPVTLTISVGF